MTIFEFLKWQPDARSVTRFSYLTDEELIDKAISLGREYEFERYLFRHERAELHDAKAELLSRLRKTNKKD